MNSHVSGHYREIRAFPGSGILTKGAIIEATPNMPPVRLWYVGRLSIGAICAMMMKEPPVTPALPIPATARFHHVEALVPVPKYIDHNHCEGEKAKPLTPMINASDVGAVAQTIEPTSKSSSAARKVCFRLQVL